MDKDQVQEPNPTQPKMDKDQLQEPNPSQPKMDKVQLQEPNATQPKMNKDQLQELNPTQPKMDKDQLQEPNSICSSVLHEDAVVIKDSDKDATEDRDTSTTVLSKVSCLSVASKHLVGSKSKQKSYPELPPAYVLPYLVLIKNCLDLPFSTIKKQCLTGEILCKIDSLTLRRKKKKPPTSLEPGKVPTLQETKYVTFEGLEDLQWKLFKGLLKRKPKTIGIWREVNYKKKSVTTIIRQAKEHILPLLPKDWIIDESLKFSKEKIFSFFLETETHL